MLANIRSYQHSEYDDHFFLPYHFIEGCKQQYLMITPFARKKGPKLRDSMPLYEQTLFMDLLN